MSIAPIREEADPFEEVEAEAARNRTNEATPLLRESSPSTASISEYPKKPWHSHLRGLWTTFVSSNPSVSVNAPTKPHRRSRLAVLAIIPILHFSTSLPITTSIDIMRSIVCILWYTMNDPDNIPDIEGIGDDGRCEAPGVNAGFSTVILMVSVCLAVGTFLSSTVIGSLSPKLGRKPLQVTAFFLASLTPLFLLLAFKVTAWLFPIWIILDSLTGPTILNLLIYMTLTDLTEEGERTTYLLLATGLGSLGRSPSFFLGGLITSLTGSYLTVYYISTAILVCTAVLFSLTVEESFPLERRAERQREIEEERRQRASASTSSLNSSDHPQAGRIKHVLSRAWDSIAAPFRLLARLLPTRNPQTGKRNYRLFILGASFFFGSFVTQYVQGTIVYATTKFHFGARQNGIMLSTVTSTQVIWLLVLSPALLHYMEAWYQPQPKKQADQTPEAESQPDAGRQVRAPASVSTEHDSDSGSTHAEAGLDYLEGPTPPSESPAPSRKGEEGWRASMIARRDVHVVFVSYVLEAASEICIGLARNGTQMILASVMLGCVGSSGPAMRSAAVASVPRLQSGEILATFELVAAIATLLAPLQGVLLTLLINTAPQIVFFLAGGISLFAAALVLFVREQDRYQ